MIICSRVKNYRSRIIIQIDFIAFKINLKCLQIILINNNLSLFIFNQQIYHAFIDGNEFY